MLLEFFLDVLPIVCIGLVLRFGDLRLWCQTLLAAALLMTLKGFTTWATVIPDKGWQVCQERLGLDGLRYYREDQPFLEIIPDIILLEVQGLWFGRSRSRFCVVTAPFDASVCLGTIFCMSICEVSLAWSAMEAEVPAMAQCLRYGLLVLLVGSALFLGSEPEATGFTVLGIVLAGAVYGNPALAIAVEAWCRWTELELKTGGPSMMTSYSTALSPNSSMALMGTRQPSDMGEEGAGDVGKVFMLPFTARYCYMQQHPQESSLLQKKALLQQLLKSMHEAQEQLLRRELKKSDLLKKEQADELLSALRADRFAEQQIQEALSDQQRLLNSRARRKQKHQTLNFEERGNAQLLKNTLRRACKSLSTTVMPVRQLCHFQVGSVSQHGQNRHIRPSLMGSLPIRLHRLGKQKPGLNGFNCGLAVCLAQQGWRRSAKAFVRRAGYSAGEVYEVPPLMEEGEAIVVWLHGVGDTGKGWSDSAPALQQMGLPMLRFLFPTAPLRGVGSKGLKPSWYDVPTLDPDQIARQPTPEGLLDGVDYVLGLVEPHVPSDAGGCSQFWIPKCVVPGWCFSECPSVMAQPYPSTMLVKLRTNPDGHGIFYDRIPKMKRIQTS
eukprot:symbB.v1.2.000865.t1/scaffold38.1/size396883/5